MCSIRFLFTIYFGVGSHKECIIITIIRFDYFLFNCKKNVMLFIEY